MSTVAIVLLVLGLCAVGQAAVVTENVRYKQGETFLEGYLAYDEAVQGKRPGVLVVHEWWGLNDYPKMRARQLAEMGYVAFAADMYGDGTVAKSPEEAGKLAGQFRANWDTGGRALMRARAKAAFDVLAANELVDPKRIAAIGFCFGGTVALELAYSGADLAAVATFHGGLTAPAAADLAGIKAKFLVLHGAEDPHVTPAAIADFEQGMRQGNLDWQMILYGGAVHAFSNPAAGSNKAAGVAYDEKAARRSWQHMATFFDEVLKGH